MWVRTQDKMQLVKINEIHIKVDEDGFVGIWVDDKKESLKYFLGTYKSKERALEVLDEIQNLLIPKVILNTYSVENKETAYSKELVIEPIINDIKVQNNVNMFYQMPED